MYIIYNELSVWLSSRKIRKTRFPPTFKLDIVLKENFGSLACFGEIWQSQLLWPFYKSLTRVFLLFVFNFFHVLGNFYFLFVLFA